MHSPVYSGKLLKSNIVLMHHKITSRTSDELCALSGGPAERPLLLFKQEVCLVRGQAAEVSPRWEVEPQLFGRGQTGLSEGQQLTVGTLLASCKGARSARTLKKQTSTYLL